MNPDLDLTLQRIIRAPRASVWRAWTDPASLERWWIPAPTRCRVERLEPRPGGALVTSMSDDGAPFVPHLDACFLVVDELELATLSWVHWFNEDRLHAHCDDVPPAEFEATFYAASATPSGNPAAATSTPSSPSSAGRMLVRVAFSMPWVLARARPWYQTKAAQREITSLHRSNWMDCQPCSSIRPG